MHILAAEVGAKVEEVEALRISETARMHRGDNSGSLQAGDDAGEFFEMHSP